MAPPTSPSSTASGRSRSDSDLYRRRPSTIGQTSLIVVSNRLPITLHYSTEGAPVIKKSSGGLVTALQGSHLQNLVWLGWAGNSEPLTPQARDMVLAEGFVPIDVDTEYYELFYTGFANSILWPLAHYLMDDRPIFSFDQWQAYVHINRQFADAIVSNYTEDCFVWIQDYHLLLVPQMIREQIPDARIGLFFHIVWPSSEIYRTLPVRVQILEGMLAADVIGFHTFSYVRHFLSSCQRLLGAHCGPTVCKYNGRTTYCSAFPIGIDPVMFDLTKFDKDKKLQTLNELDKLKEKHKDLLVICGVDRLDYIKGVPFKLQAYRLFLEKYPEFLGKVVLIQVGVPTREKVVKYQELMTETNRLVGEISGQFGTLEYTPLIYVHSAVKFPELIALYTLADLMIISSIRDGMNLVALEYTVCQKNNEVPGSLILSEFAGCSSSLSGALRVNPWDIEETADAIRDAMVMSDEERRERHQLNWNFCSVSNTAEQWADKFLKSALMFTSLKPSPKCLPLDLLSLASDYLSASHRLLLIDYDGTLVEFQRRPELAVPDEDLLSKLETISKVPNNVVYIISGRHRGDLEKWFGKSSSIGLIAEHGMVFQRPNSSEWIPVFDEEFDLTWMPEVESLMMNVANSTPGSHVEKKPASVCFHYRNVDDKDFAMYQIRELHQNILDVIDSGVIDFCFGNNVFEARAKGADKGGAAERVIKHHDSFDFILAIGDDITDEDMFSVFAKTKSDYEIESEMTAEVDMKDPTVKRMMQHIGELSSSTAPRKENICQKISLFLTKFIPF
ncbi:hypothetical protein GEMRC1_007807 [Eukaryota sp. GEM-RC1]